MRAILLIAIAVVGACARAPACELTRNKAALLVQAKIATLGNVCEDMCRRMGAYPDCNCPGFNGQAGEVEAGGSCYDAHCQDLKNPCMGGGDAGDAFMTCVKSRTAVKPSLLSSRLTWDKTLDLIQANMD